MDPKASLTAPNAIRAMIRAGDYSGPTNGFVPGFAQCNILILPEASAFEFQTYCLHNADCCPLLASSISPGNYHLEQLGQDIDIRTDIPRYRILKQGQLTEEVSDIMHLWRDDFVAFALASHLAFDTVLHSFGIASPLANPTHSLPMYISNIESHQVGPFGGPKVVCMRPMNKPTLIRAIQAGSVSRVPHGIPVHFGDSGEIGVTNLSKPNFGEPLCISSGDIPVFWTTSLTAHLAITRAAPEWCIINSPQHLLVTDKADLSLVIS
ncbi:D-glutamate cyclase family protein [Pseudoalteromonas rubra]|uniref:DUF1445 domain-containing protein n=1 Tax=Pseudoalteromonas rubra TaxID=43658 RepID=A0A5S3WZX4_9GAMM|nr:DUF1445 domain-containing protein [Pseudoalteromonas rubra]TMP37261.1 DUF1445 domain-containing protein [Pseudoalteromonas rubra]